MHKNYAIDASEENARKFLRLKQVEEEMQALSVEMQQLKDELFPDKQKKQKKSK